MFSTTYSSVCCKCSQRFQSTSDQLFIELYVTSNDLNLNDKLEEYFNMSELIGIHCAGSCKQVTQAEKRNQLTDGTATKFLLVILSRAIQTAGGFAVNRSNIKATNDVFIRLVKQDLPF